MNLIRRYMEIVEAASMEVPSPLYHVTPLNELASIMKIGIEPRAGSVKLGRRTLTWNSRVFLATSLNGANEMAMMFEDMRTRGRDFTIVVIDPRKIPGATFRRDREFEFGVWTKSHIPPSAIIGTEDVDLDSDEFRKYMGMDDEDDEEQE